MPLIQSLPSGPLDFIGDIHGEYAALCDLLQAMGYPLDGAAHPKGRRLVFLGDLFDRGPNSPKVFKLVLTLYRAGVAFVILGNHELNLLANKAKEGSGWFFQERFTSDAKYAPFETVSERLAKDIVNFLVELPLALERADVRVVHAAWVGESIELLRAKEGNAIDVYHDYEQRVKSAIKTSGLRAKYNEEQKQWGDRLEDDTQNPPMLEGTMQYMLQHQMNNPIRVITAGMECPAKEPFFSGGKWRFVERAPWWDSYEENIPVICGHYWRSARNSKANNSEEFSIFCGIAFNEWHGRQKNVFCVDFSIGARYKERANGIMLGTHATLAALNWPEQTLTFEDGTIVDTEGYCR